MFVLIEVWVCLVKQAMGVFDLMSYRCVWLNELWVCLVKCHIEQSKLPLNELGVWT